MENKISVCIISLILVFLSVPSFGQNTIEVELTVGQEKTLYLPPSVTSKNLKAGSLHFTSNVPGCVQVLYYSSNMVRIKVLKYYPSKIVIHGTYNYFLPQSQFLYSGYFDYYVTIKKIEPASISIEPTTLSLEESTSRDIKAIVTPTNSEYTLTWAVKNGSSVSLYDKSLLHSKYKDIVTVIGESEGEAVVTVRTDNNKYASCRVTVRGIKPDNIELTPSITLNVGDSQSLKPIIKPYNARCKLIWESSNLNIATVTDGTVTAVGPGICDITVETDNGKKASCEVIVPGDFSNGDSFSSLTEEGVELNFRVINAKERTCEVVSGPIFISEVRKVSIPAKAEGMTVVRIAENAFMNCKISEISIPSSVKTIEARAFDGCSNLMTIEIPNSVTSIGYLAFWGTPWYDSQPDGVVYVGKVAYSFKGNMPENSMINIEDGTISISERAFEWRLGMTSVTIPNSVTTIGAYAFANTMLNDVNIPNSVVQLGPSCFEGCESIESVKLSTNLSEIPNDAFKGCKMTALDIPNSVKVIGGRAFSHCDKLTYLHIPSSVTEICDRAFDNCCSLEDVRIEDLSAWCRMQMQVIHISNPLYYARHLYINDLLVKDLVIPDDVISIGDKAFYGFKGINSVTIGDNVKRIGSEAFYECTELKTISIGKNVEHIEPDAFSKCYNLSRVVSHIRDPYEIQSVYGDIIDEREANMFSSATLYVPYGEKSKYENTQGWKEFQHIVEMGIPFVSDGAPVDFSNIIDDDIDLNGHVIDNVFYSIGREDGGYNANDSCIEVKKTTDGSVLDDLDVDGIYDAEFNSKFTGIILRIPEGTGVVRVSAETTGNMAMVFKIGDNDPIAIQLQEKEQVTFPYVLMEDTNVYLYGATTGIGVKNAIKSQEVDGMLKLYDIGVFPDTNGIELPHLKMDDATSIYSIGGYRMSIPQRGVNIIHRKDGTARIFVVK